MLCDAPNILNALQRFGIRDEPAVKKAEAQIAGLVRENGWTCAVSPQLGKFRGPGRKEDPCPYANLIALKALLYAGDDKYSEEVEIGVQMLLDHWENQADRKKFLFGIGTTYRRLKYPFIWYDILHVLDTLSMLPSTIADSRIQEMLQLLLDLQDDQGKFKAGSVWTAWKGWEFAQKREPSPMITLLVMRILKRFARQC
jgi:hypothetical protein